MKIGSKGALMRMLKLCGHKYCRLMQILSVPNIPHLVPLCPGLNVASNWIVEATLRVEEPRSPGLTRP